MWLRTQHDLVFEISTPTPFVLMLRPCSGAQQWIVREEYELIPDVPVFGFTDDNGNLCQRLIAPSGHFTIRTTAEVMTADEVERAPGAPSVEVQYLPDAVLRYLLPSRYCESDRLGLMAREITAGLLPGYDQVAAIEAWLRSRIRHEPGNNRLPLSATEVDLRKSGNCRDLAHLGIALCRSLGIPARMVMGYLHGQQHTDTHAWFETYLAGRWYSFDATQAELRAGYVSIGCGRDAADVATYNPFGAVIHPAMQEVRVDRIQGQ